MEVNYEMNKEMSEEECFIFFFFLLSVALHLSVFRFPEFLEVP